MNKGGDSETAIRLILFTSVLSRFAGAAELVLLNWWVIVATGQAAMVGFAVMARLLPLFLAAPLLSKLADRIAPLNILAFALWCGTLCTMLIAYVIRVHGDSLYSFQIIILILVLRSIILSPEPALRQLAIAKLVPSDRLVPEMARLSTILTLCLILGPAASGVFLSSGGVGAGLVAISFTYLVSAVISIFALRQSRKYIGEDLPEGRDGARGMTLFRDIKMILGEKNLSRQILLATGPMFSIFPYTAMIPVIFADDFKLPPGVAAAVGSCAAAAGAVCSATLLRRYPPVHVDRSSWRSAVGVSFPIMLAACVYLFAKNLIALSIIFVVIGAVGQRYRTLNRSAVLLATPESKRGMVLGVASVDRVLIPLGTFIFGVIADLFGVFTMLMGMASANLGLILLIYLFFTDKNVIKV